MTDRKPGPKRKRPGYWKEYDARYRTYDIGRLYDHVEGLARELGQPFGRRGPRGRPFALEPYEYAALFVVMVFRDMSLRDMEMESEALAGRHVDHSTLADAVDKVPEAYLRRLLRRSREAMQPFLEGLESVHIADSTKARVDREKVVAERGTEAVTVARTEPLCLMAEYFPDRGVMPVEDAVAGVHSDPQALVAMLVHVEPEGEVYADAGFDGRDVFETCWEMGLAPRIRLKERESLADAFRKWGLRQFDAEAYKATRGVVEGVFGGLESRRLLFTRFHKSENVHKSLVAQAIAHNLQTWMRLSCCWPSPWKRSGSLLWN